MPDADDVVERTDIAPPRSVLIAVSSVDAVFVVDELTFVLYLNGI
jgi:hypothetical protein